MPVKLTQKKINYAEGTIEAVGKIRDGYYLLRRLQDLNYDQSFVDGGKNSLVDNDFESTDSISHLDLATFTAGLKGGVFPIIGIFEANDFAVRRALQSLLVK